MYKRNQVFAAACIALLLFGIILITLGSILPAITEKFKLDELSTGKMVSLLPSGILIGSLLFGPIVDRFGYKVLLISSVLISIIGLEGLAFTKSFAMLRACIFNTGLGGGCINGGTNALVADISAVNKGANLSLLGVFFGIGALGMPLLLGVLSKFYQYPAIISGVGLLMLLIIIYFVAIRFPLPKLAQGFPIKEGIKLLKEPALLLTAFFLFFQSGVEGLVNNWTTTFLKLKLNTSSEDALYALTFYVAGLTITRLVLGSLLKKMSSYVLQLISLLLIAAGSVMILYTSSYAFAFPGLIITGIGLSAGFPVILGYIGQLYEKLSGTAFSIALVIALTGNTMINYFFGLIAHYYTATRLPVLILVCTACMIIILLLIKQTIDSKLKL
jgi:FHS family glucose/mannose:H+ symporter-like MFS transporter